MRDSSFVQFTGPELLISLRSVNAFNHNYVEDRQIKFQTLEVKNIEVAFGNPAVKITPLGQLL